MNNIDMKKIGFTQSFSKKASEYIGLYPGRVSAQGKNLYEVICEKGEIIAEVSGRLRFEAKTPSDFPAVGDFVMVDRQENDNGNAIIHHILPRRSAFIRKSAGTSKVEQIVATNIDTIFICMALNNDFNLRRLERYLSIGWDSGAVPVVVLTKSDLCNNLEQRTYEASEVALGAELVVTTALAEEGYNDLLPYIKESETIAFIGSSGVGKSTLINRLMGEASRATNSIRKDDKGKHTTTRRELILLSNGAMVIDTPGMRELGLENADLSKAFSDIDELALKCKFRDCTHRGEPGCAVQDAIVQGIISRDRLISYQKLKKEVNYEGLDSRQIDMMKLNSMTKSFGGKKNARKFIKEKTKRR